MIVACGCGGQSARSYRTPISTVSPGVASAVQAGAGEQYEVVKANGASSGRRFTSLVAAARYATAIGGNTRPVGVTSRGA